MAGRPPLEFLPKMAETEITRMEAAIGWVAHYLNELDDSPLRGIARCVQFVAWHRSAERETEWIARRLRLAPVTVRRRNRTGLDIIASGLRRDDVRVF